MLWSNVIRSGSETKKQEKIEEPELMPIQPLPMDKFRPTKIKTIIEPYLEKTLQKIKVYNADEAQNLCKKMSTDIREMIKSLKLERYK